MFYLACSPTIPQLPPHSPPSAPGCPPFLLPSLLSLLLPRPVFCLALPPPHSLTSKLTLNRASLISLSLSLPVSVPSPYPTCVHAHLTGRAHGPREAVEPAREPHREAHVAVRLPARGDGSFPARDEVTQCQLVLHTSSMAQVVTRDRDAKGS